VLLSWTFPPRLGGYFGGRLFYGQFFFVNDYKSGS
jgi:hypothetical protein